MKLRSALNHRVGFLALMMASAAALPAQTVLPRAPEPFAGKIGETYNIGGHNEKKNIDVVLTICDLLDEIVPKEQSYREQITYVADRPGHDRRYAIDAEKISRELGWKPQETFESGIRKTVEWYLSNTKWVDNVKSGAYQSWIEQNYEGRQ